MRPFVKADFEPFPFFRVAVGGRFEEATQFVSPRALFLGEAQPSQPPVREEEYFLPAGTVTWNFLDDWQLRVGAIADDRPPAVPRTGAAAVSRSGQRPPVHRQPVPGRHRADELRHASRELLRPNQFFTIGAFYKDIENPVESVVREQGNTIQQTFLNAPKAVLYGAEVELRTTFTDPLEGMFWIGGKDIFLQSNYTWSKSEVQVKDGDIVFPEGGGGAGLPAENYLIDGSRLQGQSEHVVNLQLGWEDPIASEQGTFIMNYVSERSSARGRPGEPDLIQEPGVTLDFVYRREFDAYGKPVTFSLQGEQPDQRGLFRAPGIRRRRSHRQPV